MAELTRTYRTRVSGLWRPRHTLLDEEGRTLGTLTVGRNRWGLVVSGEYRPEKGEVLHFRRDPGLLRAQFSLWTDGREWLGSSLRWSVGRRQIDLWTGGKPYRVVPTRGLGRGWRLIATKTGEAASIRPRPFSRGATLRVHRKVDFELLLFAYFLGSMTSLGSLPPTVLDQDVISPKPRKTAPPGSSDRPVSAPSPGAPAEASLGGSKARAELPRT